MSGSYFGTDGVRGRYGVEPITEAFTARLGYALARSLADSGAVAIGRDTRASGPALAEALAAGIHAAGREVLDLGVMPTPGVAVLTEELGAAAGAVISASHNPAHDNGIKFFDAAGGKIPDALQAAIEAALDAEQAPAGGGAAVRAVDDAVQRYCAFARATFPRDRSLGGMRIGLDCAHGAMSAIAPQVLRDLGAELTLIGCDPDGGNINAGVGSTHMEALVALVREQGLDLGVAFDGDGDRVQMVAADGGLMDGDDLIHLIAHARHRDGALEGPVVGTVMSNLALEQAVAELGYPFVRTKVGDRHVLAALREQAGVLGGETSGHILCLDRSGTGDGLVAALQALAALADGAPPALDKYPQLLINVRVALEGAPGEHPEVAAAVAGVEAALAGSGRVVLRASGTEPVIRVMVEGREEAEVREYAQAIAMAVESAGSAVGE